MLDRFERPLSESEVRRIRRRATAVRERLWRGPRTALKISSVLCGVLCVVTLLASTVEWRVIVVFWAAMALVFTALAVATGLRDLLRLARQLEETARLGKAEVVRVRCGAMVELEEIEDEGACYAFQVEPDKVLVVDGQEFYATKRFPNEDFDLVHVRDGSGQLVELFIETHGRPLTPSRTIPSTIKGTLEVPEHLSVVPGKLDELERVFARAA